MSLYSKLMLLPHIVHFFSIIQPYGIFAEVAQKMNKLEDHVETVAQRSVDFTQRLEKSFKKHLEFLRYIEG